MRHLEDSAEGAEDAELRLQLRHHLPPPPQLAARQVCQLCWGMQVRTGWSSPASCASPASSSSAGCPHICGPCSHGKH